MGPLHLGGFTDLGRANPPVVAPAVGGQRVGTLRLRLGQAEARPLRLTVPKYNAPNPIPSPIQPKTPRLQTSLAQTSLAQTSLAQKLSLG